METFIDRVVRALHWTTIVIEVLVAIALVVLAVGVLMALGATRLLHAGRERTPSLDAVRVQPDHRD